MTDRQLKRLEYVRQRVPQRAGLFERCYTGRASLATRIRAFCVDCQGINMRAAKSCGYDACPLWGGRPSSWKGGRPAKPPTEEQKQKGKDLYRRFQESRVAAETKQAATVAPEPAAEPF
jgi:hypothetical protein